jgi:hypothetical protein
MDNYWKPREFKTVDRSKPERGIGVCELTSAESVASANLVS